MLVGPERGSASWLMPGREAKPMSPVQNKMVNGSFIILPVRLALPCSPWTEMDSIYDAGAMCGRLLQWIFAGIGW
jgi:hypothetical protein